MAGSDIEYGMHTRRLMRNMDNPDTVSHITVIAEWHYKKATHIER